MKRFGQFLDGARNGALAVVLTWIFVCVVALFVSALSGCPLRPTPPTPAICPSRPNCGQCSSEAVCAWCASEGADRGCVSAVDPGACAGVLVSVPERCPDDATSDP